MLGVIGGTGLYQMEGLKNIKTKELSTPFGNPSAPITIGEWEGREVAFLPRHGLTHSLLPSEINFRANIWALKAVGVRQVVSVSASGSLVKEIHPGELVCISQYLDWTKGKRDNTFFGNGMVAHIATSDPACPSLSELALKSAEKNQIKLHTGKTYACVEGPRLGTRAESFFLKNAGCHTVGMTNVPEAFLAREAQLCYCTLAVATDYDCWMEDPEAHVRVDKVLALYKASLSQVQKILRTLFSLSSVENCTCRKALEFALLTPEASLSSDNKKILEFLRQ